MEERRISEYCKTTPPDKEIRRSLPTPEPSKEEEVLLPAEAEATNYTKIDNESTVVSEVYVGYSHTTNKCDPVGTSIAHTDWLLVRALQLAISIESNARSRPWYQSSVCFNQSIEFSINQLFSQSVVLLSFKLLQKSWFFDYSGRTWHRSRSCYTSTNWK